jgi:hypothetical protein
LTAAEQLVDDAGVGYSLFVQERLNGVSSGFTRALLTGVQAVVENPLKTLDAKCIIVTAILNWN